MGLHADLWESSFSPLSLPRLGEEELMWQGWAEHPTVGCCVLQAGTWAPAPLHALGMSCAALWVLLVLRNLCLAFMAMFFSAFATLALPDSAMPPLAGCPHPKCSATKRGGGTGMLLVPFFAPQRFQLEAQHTQMP